MKNIIQILTIILLPYFLFAQNTGSLKGIILNESNEAVAYATISIFNSKEELIIGAISDEKGAFEIGQLPLDSLVVALQFIGYERFRKQIVISRKNKKIDLGNIMLQPDQQFLEEVTVTGEKSDFNLKLDKKVFNVGKDVLSQAGSAIDLLDQVPLVSVDPNGTVELRGSSQVQILINGKRSGLTMNNALDQIPAQNIEKIEVITNPSASFDASGSAGIINIVLKKDLGQGWNGQVRVQAGIPANHIVMPGINYKGDKINVFSNFRWRYSDYNGTYSTEQKTINNGVTNFLSQQEDEDRHDDGRSAYGGIDYYLNDNNSFTLAFFRAETKDSDKTVLKYQLNTEGQNPNAISTNGSSIENRNYNQLESNYTRTFKEEGRKFTVDFQYDFWNSTKDWHLMTDGDFIPENIGNQLRTTNKAGSQDYVLKSDYMHPLKKDNALEGGIKLENRMVSNDYLAEVNNNDNWDIYNSIDNNIDYSERIGAAYLQYKGNVKNLEYMVGLRAEYTLLAIEDEEDSFTNNDDYVNFFPSTHLSYQFSQKNTIQWSYSRRINRPSLWNLYPFSEIKDFNLQEVGNPNLLPSFAHALEVAYLGVFDKLTLNPGIYYRHTSNPFSNFIYQNDRETFIVQSINIDQRATLGFEASIRYRPIKAISLSTEFNYFHFEERGAYEGVNLAASGKTWFARGNANFNLPKGIRLQSRFDYYAPEKRAQVKELSNNRLSFGISKSFLKDKVAISIYAFNILNSNKSRTISEAENYRIENSSQRYGARWSVTAVYKFNQSDRERMREANRGNR